jgi:5-methylcytosine-specific restriction protein B
MKSKKQWEKAIDVVTQAGRPVTAQEVWTALKKDRPETPLSSIRDSLECSCVNSPSRTSHPGGREARFTDPKYLYDRLFKIDGRYVPYDPGEHGVWEVYADPAATSSHKTSIRKVDGPAQPSITMTLTDGAVKPGNTFFPVKFVDEDFFPASIIRSKNPDAPAMPAQFATDAGTSFQSDVYRSSINSGYLHNRAAASAYYKAVKAERGGALRFDKLGDGRYRISYLPPMAGQQKAGDKAGMPMQKEQATVASVNRILYGPPGTGKTYATVDAALEILDPAFLVAHVAERVVLKQRFDALAEAGLIHFVTFHQSFSYEDFVEGIRADVDDGDTERKEASGALKYRVEPGVFKQLCEAARSRTVAEDGESIDLTGRRIWKLSLGDANAEGHIYDECIANGCALLGFGADLDFSGVASRSEIVERLRAADELAQADGYAARALELFVRRMKVGDLVVISQGNLKFRAIGEIIGDYHRIDRDGADTYSQCRPVKWLRRYDPARPYAELVKGRFSQMTIYELRAGAIDRHRLTALLAPEPAGEHAPTPRVLIIDEINRGNVSRIFGELITLIEPGKRERAAEALSVTLPYSKERFSVPANVHLIGTMNTADRSLAGLDVALRRRFEFVEMAPQPKLLDQVVVEGIVIGELLRAMNQRIEVLLGRDYTLGHAYFMRLKTAPSMDQMDLLADVFRKQVLPLLQEYFFEDWQKIAWVLNDHRKSDASLRFLQRADISVGELFGDGVDLPGDARLWRVNEAAFNHSDAYRSVIKAV